MIKERIGLIDVGSNTIRLVIFEIDDFFNYTELQNIKTPARLVQYVQDGVMNETGIKVLGKTLASYAQIVKQYQISRLFPIATAAIRQSKNSDKILQYIKDYTNIELDILSEEQEAYYGNYAVRHTMKIRDGVSIDIGGGSAEITLFKDKKVVETTSFPFGAVSLQQKFFADKDHNDKKAIKKTRKYVREYLNQFEWLKNIQVPLIGLGGSARNIADVYQRKHDYPLAGIHGYCMDKGWVTDTIDLFISLPLKELGSLDGLSQDRRDLIIPAGIVFTELLEVMDSDCFAISNRGLREGIIMEYLNEANNQIPYNLNGLPQQTVYRLSKQYKIREITANQRITIADMLLNELEKLKILTVPVNEVELLHFGAALYYLGSYIEDDSKSQHTYYIISNTNLHGFNHKERVRLALVASFKNKSLFKQYTADLKEWFDDTELDRLVYLGGIVKFAEALNDSHVNQVKKINLEKLDDNQYKMIVNYSGRVVGEAYRANKQKNHFERILGGDLTLEFMSGDKADN